MTNNYPPVRCARLNCPGAIEGTYRHCTRACGGIDHLKKNTLDLLAKRELGYGDTVGPMAELDLLDAVEVALNAYIQMRIDNSEVLRDRVARALPVQP